MNDDDIVYQPLGYSSIGSVLVDVGVGMHPRGKKQTRVVAVIYKHDGRVRIVEWHIHTRFRGYEGQKEDVIYRVLSSHRNSMGKYWQFDFKTKEEVQRFLRQAAATYTIYSY